MRLDVSAEPIGDCHVGYRAYCGTIGAMNFALRVAGGEKCRELLCLFCMRGKGDAIVNTEIVALCVIIAF